jgi:hypothetical protein
MKKNLFFFIFIFNFTFYILHFSIAPAIEVGGHLTEDTIWSPDNNPYLVTSGVYVDVGVTLTILPGTVVKFNADYYDDIGDDQFYFHGGVEPVAKFIRVDGRIIAEGTEQDSIIFTRMQDEEYFHWGTIYIPEGAQSSRFKYCLFEFSAFTGFSLSEQPRAAIALWNGSAKVVNCSFIDNDRAINIEKNVTDILAINNYFDYFEYPHPNIISLSGKYFFLIRYIFNVDTGTPFIAHNIFKHGTAAYSSKSMYFVDNSIESVTFNRKAIYLSSNTYEKSYFYNNEIGSCSTGIDSSLDSIYIKNNHFATNSGKGIEIDDAYVEISDNYFEECDLDTGLECNGRIYNNIVEEGNVRTSAYLDVYQNIGFNGEAGITITYRNESCFNNLSINNQYAFNGVFSGYYNNCIFVGNDELSLNGVHGNPIFRNCILDFDIEPPCIDGGGNIWVDSLQAQTLFEDIQNGDFHLIEGSLAIDAGFDTTGYYYPFDMDYNHRVWDGDNNGTSIIDIGPYEYNSPSFGGIEGYTYNPTTEELVDYVLLKINNQPCEFTFSDSIGNFQYKLPAGTYDVYAERVFYDDAVLYEIEVNDGQFTQIQIPMFETVDAEDYEIPKSEFLIFNLTNFPNPFNPETTIRFTTENTEKNTELIIYNIKGQEVRKLINEHLIKGTHSVLWNGLDSNSKLVSSGIYFYKISSGKESVMKKMLLLK